MDQLICASLTHTHSWYEVGMLKVPAYSYCCILHINRSGLNHTSNILHINRSGLNHTSNIRGCQSGTWSQRGTKVNGSHHGDNPLLRPTGIQIATKCYATLHAMAPTNNKTVHQTSFTLYREQPRSTRIVVAYPRPASFTIRYILSSSACGVCNSLYLTFVTA